MIFLLGLFLRVQALPALATALTVVIAVTSWWSKRSLDGVNYGRRFHYTRAFPGETVNVRLDVENRKLLPLSWLRTRDPWPKAVGPEDEEVLAPTHLVGMGQLTNLFSLRWFERARRQYTLRFRKRGVYSVGPAILESGDLFGMYAETREHGPAERLTVFPTLVPMADLGLDAEDPFGDRRSRRRLFEDPSRPMGVRGYQPEDEFRRMHWPATARTGQLQVKVYQSTSEQMMLVCLNAATFPRHWEGVYPELLEYLLQVAASLVYEGMQEGYQVGLISNGTLANADQPFRILPARSTHHLANLLEALAGVTPVVTAPFERFLLREVPRIPYGATLVVVTAVVTPELNETLLRTKKKGRRVMLASLAKEPPPEIPGIRVIHLPFQEAPAKTRRQEGKN